MIIIVLDGADGPVEMLCRCASCPRGRAVDGYAAAAIGILSLAYRGSGFVTHRGFHAGHAATDGDVAARAMGAAADTSAVLPAIGRDGAATDGNSVTSALGATADARCTVAARGGDGAAIDVDVAARAMAAGADACRSTRGRDGAAVDGDSAAETINTSTDAGSITRGRDSTALNNDVAAVDTCVTCAALISAADACAALARCISRQRACALDGERLALGYEDGGLTLGRRCDGVCTIKNDSGIALASDGGTTADIDGSAIERIGTSSWDDDSGKSRA